jgi:hypothetical protein
MSSEASQLEEYVRWSRASNAHQSAAYGGRPSIEDAALHLTAAGLRGLGNMQAGAQFNHLPIGRPLQLLDSGIGGKMDQASMVSPFYTPPPQPFLFSIHPHRNQTQSPSAAASAHPTPIPGRTAF